MRTAQLAAKLVSLVCGTGRVLAGSLLDLVYPEKCVLCGAEPGEKSWCASGPFVPGLCWHDAPHLCRSCGALFGPAPVRGFIAQGTLPTHGGRHPNADLVQALSQWKYHGVRGLAWPLAKLLSCAVGAAVARDGAVDQLVPVGLYARRRRTRGFNQAEVLARLVGIEHNIPVAGTLLQRTRSTGQQARLKTAQARQNNLAGAFSAESACAASAADGVCGLRIGLVDDLVTSGATCEAAAVALKTQGWQVCWVAALGLADTTI